MTKTFDSKSQLPIKINTFDQNFHCGQCVNFYKSILFNQQKFKLTLHHSSRKKLLLSTSSPSKNSLEQQLIQLLLQKDSEANVSTRNDIIKQIKKDTSTVKNK